MKAFVRHERDVLPVPCPCGMATRIITAADGGASSFHVTRIREAKRHWHARISEVYYILEGNGKVELDGEWHTIEPGSVVNIPAGTRHRIISETGIKTIVIATPPFDPADEHLT